LKSVYYSEHNLGLIACLVFVSNIKTSSYNFVTYIGQKFESFQINKGGTKL
jgi:hypothetical protein